MVESAHNKVKKNETCGFISMINLLIPMLEKIANPTPIKDSPAIRPEEMSNPL